jgi:hypothetical protein
VETGHLPPWCRRFLSLGRASGTYVGTTGHQLRINDWKERIVETSVILNQAADLIERDGWWSQNPNVVRGGVRPQCAANAITDVSASFDALYAFSAHVAGVRRMEAIWKWNDADDRTAAEVVEALRAAAVIEAAKENAEARTQVPS